MPFLNEKQTNKQTKKVEQEGKIGPVFRLAPVGGV
jgi:hypothetical protein